QAISPLIGEWVAHWIGFPAFITATAVACIAALGPTLPLAALLNETRFGPQTVAVTDADGRHPLYWPLLIYAGFIGSLFGAMLTFVPVMFLQAGADNVGPFFIGCSGAAVFVRIFFGGWGDRGDRDRIMAASGALAIFTVALTAALGFHIAEAGPHRLLMVLIGSMFGFGVGFFYPVANARFIELGPDALRGKYMSYYSTTYATGITTASFVYGYVVEWAGYGWMFAVASALASMALGLWILRFSRSRRARISAPA
ncbi:MAG: MFS transporter, partial [Candidatus Dadabacteria bacterium]